MFKCLAFVNISPPTEWVGGETELGLSTKVKSLVGPLQLLTMDYLCKDST